MAACSYITFVCRKSWRRKVGVVCVLAPETKKIYVDLNLIEMVHAFYMPFTNKIQCAFAERPGRFAN